MINNQIEILATGLNGLVGSRLKKDFGKKYNFYNLDLRDQINSVDITNSEQVLQVINDSRAEFLIHFAAFTDVNRAWEQSNQKDGLAYQVNVIGTKNIIQACEQTGKHLIHISTAYVFDGQKDSSYTEEDQPNPIEWYGQTKYEAEQVVQQSKAKWTILRIDQPFRSDPAEKTDRVHKIIADLKDDSLPPQFSNHYFGPTFVDDFSKVLDWVIRSKTTGLFHASSGEKWSDYDFASYINDLFEFNKTIVPGNIESYLASAVRPYQINTALNCKKLTSVLDFKLTPIKEALKLVSL